MKQALHVLNCSLEGTPKEQLGWATPAGILASTSAILLPPLVGIRLSKHV
jgi:hypothetical protein